MKNTAYNLMKGFLRESHTRIRYEIYSEIAKKEKFLLISKTYKEFATHKREHANLFFQMLQQLKKKEFFENITLEITCPSTYGTTIENLESSIKEEDEEWQKIYPSFANAAEVEGYKDIAEKIKQFSQTKRNHSQRLKMFLKLLEGNTFSEKDKVSFWKCMSCGFEVAMDELPNDFSCPTCGHVKSYFQKKTLHIVRDELLYHKKETSGWVCMECGHEVALEELPNDWKCASCGRSKAYFKRKVLKKERNDIKSTGTEKALWVCLECGNEEEIEMPPGWKCLKCGLPNRS